MASPLRLSPSTLWYCTVATYWGGGGTVKCTPRSFILPFLVVLNRQKGQPVSVQYTVGTWVISCVWVVRNEYQTLLVCSPWCMVYTTTLHVRVNFELCHAVCHGIDFVRSHSHPFLFISHYLTLSLSFPLPLPPLSLPIFLTYAHTGQVTLDKHSHIRTVVNKTDQIDDTFRFFKMEVLAGDDDMITTVKENGCSFMFDFSKVYWNSRLHTEHERLIKGLKRGDVVLDVFAGVGPFSIPAAKKGCLVHANDLNPHSYESLCTNAKVNSVTHKLKAYNLDGREFIKKVTHDLLAPQQPSQEPLNTFTKHNIRIIMNLPATAVQFLDTFRGLFSCVPSDHRSSIRLPTIYCYCFSKSEDAPDKDALQMVQRSLGVSSLRAGTYSTHAVRSVAPNKVMMKVTFELPPEVAFFEEIHADGSLKLPPSSSFEGSNTDVCSYTPHPEDGSTSLPYHTRKGDMDAALSCDSRTDEGRYPHTCELEAAGTRTSGVEGDSKGELHPQPWDCNCWPIIWRWCKVALICQLWVNQSTLGLIQAAHARLTHQYHYLINVLLN